VATGISDCWSAGSCYALAVAPTFSRGATEHADRLITEVYTSTGAPTPGSPIRVHIGATYTDVPLSSILYGAIESVTHAEIADSCTAPPACTG
jgi:hypothetical protein